jgi:hypothetical protein
MTTKYLVLPVVLQSVLCILADMAMVLLAVPVPRQTRVTQTHSMTLISLLNHLLLLVATLIWHVDQAPLRCKSTIRLAQAITMLLPLSRFTIRVVTRLVPRLSTISTDNQPLSHMLRYDTTFPSPFIRQQPPNGTQWTLFFSVRPFGGWHSFFNSLLNDLFAFFAAGSIDRFVRLFMIIYFFPQE